MTTDDPTLTKRAYHCIEGLSVAVGDVMKEGVTTFDIARAAQEHSNAADPEAVAVPLPCHLSAQDRSVLIGALLATLGPPRDANDIPPLAWAYLQGLVLALLDVSLPVSDDEWRALVRGHVDAVETTELIRYGADPDAPGVKEAMMLAAEQASATFLALRRLVRPAGPIEEDTPERNPNAQNP